MSNVFLLNYKVKGIKTLDEEVSLSFYKKTITTPIDTQKYNIKGIYGMNGSGKSGIIASVDILKNIIVDEGYLSNPIVQKKLDAIVNKKTKELYIEVEFLGIFEEEVYIYNYEVILKKNNRDKFEIDAERISYKMVISIKGKVNSEFKRLIEVKKGIIDICDGCDLNEIIMQRTMNRLSASTVSSIFCDIVMQEVELNNFGVYSELFFIDAVIKLRNLGVRIDVYVEQSDNHTDYLVNNMLKYSVETDNFVNNMLKYSVKSDNKEPYIAYLKECALKMNSYQFSILSDSKNMVLKDDYDEYVKIISRLKNFIQIFKPDLTDIDIERKDDGEAYVCSLNMVYGDYIVNTEFESTGIKKLIKLFAYIQKMVQGGIVFIDEFDSNLHDVYLCALLEYLMEYGKGQLCFTTHNVGPMDVLKRNKKSIDFLSIDHKIYPWTTNGNYSPSKLYKNGMIEGSPFNVDSFDFIGIFDSLGEDD